MELPLGAVGICPVNFPSPLAALRAPQPDCASVVTAVAASPAVKDNNATIAAGAFLMSLSGSVRCHTRLVSSDGTDRFWTFRVDSLVRKAVGAVVNYTSAR